MQIRQKRERSRAESASGGLGAGKAYGKKAAARGTAGFFSPYERTGGNAARTGVAVGG